MLDRLTVLSCSFATLFLFACQAGPTEDISTAVASARPSMSDGGLPILPLDEVKPSQSGSVSQTIANTEITVTYDRPVARGRELYGGIVAYGEIWNSGAGK